MRPRNSLTEEELRRSKMSVEEYSEELKRKAY